jgi:2-desacetyl-2-hydroxyethyl bacteriochlorophyllide A dehydrogenase
MRQAIIKAPGVIELGEVPDARAGEGQVLLRIHRIGVCGSDIHVYHGTHPFTNYPTVQGHEFFATVEALGEGVEGLRVGMKVTATPQEVCGTCRPCRAGRYNICENLRVRGFVSPGVAQDLYATEVDKIVVLPDNFTPEQGAFIEPVAVAAHSTSRAGDMRGKNVVVLGAGPIGNLVAQGCKARGAKKILITDLSDYRLDVANRVGIDAVSRAGVESLAEASRRVFGDEGFDLALEAAGSEATMEAAIASIDKGGRIVVVGVFGSKPRMDMARVGEHELEMIGTMMYLREDYEQAVRWVAEGSIALEPLCSRHFPLESYQEAYRYLDESGAQAVKVFIDL